MVSSLSINGARTVRAKRIITWIPNKCFFCTNCVYNLSADPRDWESLLGISQIACLFPLKPTLNKELPGCALGNREEQLLL